MSVFSRPTRDEILTGHPLGMMARIGAPAVVSSILFTFYNLADAIWIGRLPGGQPETVMAGIQISWPFVWLLISFVAGFAGAAVTALVAQNIGANRLKDANTAMNQLFTLSLIAGIVIGLTGYFSLGWILSFLINDLAVAHQADLYMRILFLGMPTMMLPQLFYMALSATGDTLTPLLVSLIGVIINIPLDGALVLGWGPFPQMGIEGVAIATVIAQGLVSLVFIVRFLRRRGILHLDRTALALRWRWVRKALGIGLPASIGQTSVALGFLLMIYVIGRLDNPAAALAGYGVADRIFGLLFIATDGLGVGLTTMIGQALGAQLMDRARELVRKGIAALFCIVLVEAAFLYVARYPLIRVFLPAGLDAVEVGARFIQLFAVGMPFLSAFFAAQAIYRGAGHNVPPMILGILRVWVLRIPLSYAFAFLLHMQADGVWIGMSLSNVVSGLASLAWLSTRSWQRSVIDDSEEEAESP
jgi:putative MATE family efflux protein